MTFLRLGARSITKAQQIERTVPLGQVLPGEVERACRGIDGAMTEQELDGAQVHPGFQEMRSKAVPQGMDAFAMGDTSGALGVGVELLGGSDRHGLGGVCAGKEPRCRAVEFPVGPQCGEETSRQEGGAVLAAFALIDTDQHAVTFDVGALQAHDFTDAQARGRGGHEQGPIPRVGGARAQALECFDTHQVRQEPPSRAWGHVEVERIPTEGRDREKLASTGDLVPGTPREVAFDQSMVQGGANLVRAELVG